MAYKNVSDQRAASKRHYEANKDKYLLRNIKYRAFINDYVQNLKSNTPCADCKILYPYYVMDFDHLSGDNKINNISYFSSTGRISMLKKEIQKCDIVCSNCHRERTHKRLSARSSAD